VSAKQAAGGERDDRADGNRDRQQQGHPGSERDKGKQPRRGQERTTDLECGHRTEPELRGEHDSAGLLDDQQQEAEPGERCAQDELGRVAGDRGKAAGAGNTHGHDSEPERQQAVEQPGATRPVPHRVLAQADQGEAGVGDHRDHTDQRENGDIAAEVLDAQVPDDKRRGGQVAERAEAIADDAQ
jgi:hypothetical protein